MKQVFAFLLLAGLGFAQVTPDKVRSVTSLPASCNPGGFNSAADHVDLWDGSANHPKYCSSPNVWSDLGGGSLPNPFFFNSNIPGSPLSFPAGGTSNIAINVDGNFAVAPSGTAHYSDVPTKAVLGYTDDYKWLLSPTSPTTLTAATPATVTLTACPRGLDTNVLNPNSDTLGSDYFVDIGGTGTPEYVGVTATTCTFAANGASGTITFTPANSHSAGYTVGTATEGAQECVNATGLASRESACRLPCQFPITWDAPLELHTNALTLDGGGCSRVYQTHRQQGIIMGDHNAGANDYFMETIQNFQIAPAYAGTIPQVNLISSVSWTGAPGPCTYTITYTANHDFKLWEWIVNWGFLNQNQIAGIQQVASIPAANQITFKRDACSAQVGTVYAGGYSIVDYTAFEDNLNLGGTLRNVAVYAYVSPGINQAYNWHFINTSDESAVLDNFGNTNSGNSTRQCTTEFCPANIFEPGPSTHVNANGAGIITLTNSSMYCNEGNCVTNYSGNDLFINNTILENWKQWAILSSTRRGGFGIVNVSATHLEPENCLNPFNSLLGCGGIIDTGMQNFEFSGVGVSGVVPSYGSNGAANLIWHYYVIPHNSNADTFCSVTQPNDQRCGNLGTGPMLPIGAAFADSGSGGTFTVAWPAIRSATSYDLLRSTQTSTLPEVMPFGTQNVLIAANLNPATVCSGGSGQVAGEPVCTFVDNVGLTPSNYSVPVYGQTSWCPFLDYWSGGLVVACGSDLQASNGVYATPYKGNAPSTFITTNTPGTRTIKFTTPTLWPTALASNLQAYQYDAVSGLGATSTYAGNTTFMPAKTAAATPANDALTNIKGVLNFEYSYTTGAKSYPYDVITIEDCNFIKTLSTVGGHPSNDACDTALGLDSAGGLSERSKNHIAWYINTKNDNSSWKMLLDSAGLHIGSGPGQVQITVGAFSRLAACAAGTEGTMAPVNDSSTNTWGATVTGGGANHIIAYCDSANWTVMGK